MKIENMNRPVTGTETETVIKSLPTNKSPGPDGFTHEFCETFWKSSEILSKNCWVRSTSKHILWSHHQPDTKAAKDITKKKRKKANYRPISYLSRSVEL